jgi:hypothetical protein
VGHNEEREKGGQEAHNQLRTVANCDQHGQGDDKTKMFQVIKNEPRDAATQRRGNKATGSFAVSNNGDKLFLSAAKKKNSINWRLHGGAQKV